MRGYARGIRGLDASAFPLDGSLLRLGIFFSSLFDFSQGRACVIFFPTIYPFHFSTFSVYIPLPLPKRCGDPSLCSLAS